MLGAQKIQETNTEEPEHLKMHWRIQSIPSVHV
jgi:hypothetical protein